MKRQGYHQAQNLRSIFLNVLGDGMECVSIWEKNNS